MVYNLIIADLPLSERPRERLMELGARNLSSAELIAILLVTGQGKGKLSAVGLAQYILHQLSENKGDPLDVLREISHYSQKTDHSFRTKKRYVTISKNF